MTPSSGSADIAAEPASETAPGTDLAGVLARSRGPRDDVASCGPGVTAARPVVTDTPVVRSTFRNGATDASPAAEVPGPDRGRLLLLAGRRSPLGPTVGRRSRAGAR